MLRMLLAGFRRLMPREEPFIEHFAAHSEKMVAAAGEFRAMLAGEGTIEDRVAAICRLEEEADAITKTTIEAIHKSFITPFDRSDIRELINALDDTVDIMKDAGRRIILRGVHEFTPEMRGMAERVVRCTELVREAIPLLKTITRDVDRLNAICEEIKRIEGEADDLRDAGLKVVWENPELTAGQKLIVENLYELIESVVDRCEDLADTIGNIVTEQV